MAGVAAYAYLLCPPVQLQSYVGGLPVLLVALACNPELELHYPATTVGDPNALLSGDAAACDCNRRSTSQRKLWRPVACSWRLAIRPTRRS